MRVGHSPLWGDRAAKASGWRAFLLFPLLLWERIFYSRIDVTTCKTRPGDWRRLQGDRRFFDAMFCYVGPPSHFIWNLRLPLALVMLVSAGMAVYEYCRTTLGWGLPELDRNDIMYDTFRLASFAMALLLSLRVGRTYDRWWVARCGFAGVGNAATALTQQAAAWVDDEDLQADIRRWAVVWHYSVLQVVQGDKELRPAAAALLCDGELALYSASRKGRQMVASQLRLLVREAGLAVELTAAMEQTIGKGWADAGNCVRLRFQAMPAGLALISTGFVLIWLMLIPFGVWTTESWFALGAMFFVALLLLSVDEIATQMENPFPLLPMDEMMDSTVRDTERALSEAAALRRLRQSRKPGSQASLSHAAVTVDGG